MIMIKHTKLCSAIFLLTASAASNTREILYEEDFSDGAIPFGWSTADLSGQDAVWTYCADPNSGQSNGCPPLWDDALNDQGPFASTTADNGFMTLDSDLYGNLPTSHISILEIGPFNFSNETSV